MKDKKESQTPRSDSARHQGMKNSWGHYRAAPRVKKLGNAVVPEGRSQDTVTEVLVDFRLLETAVYKMRVFVGQQQAEVEPEQLLRPFKKVCTNPLYHNPAYMATIIDDCKVSRRARPGMIAKAMIQKARGLKKNTVESYIKDGRQRENLETKKLSKTTV